MCQARATQNTSENDVGRDATFNQKVRKFEICQEHVDMGKLVACALLACAEVNQDAGCGNGHILPGDVSSSY